MTPTLKSVARRGVESLIRPYGYELTLKKDHDWDDYETFLPFQTTLAESAKAGLSVGDYVDLKHNVPGATQATIDQMAAHGVFEHKIESVCEIGPGSGRYLEKTLRACSPGRYEIYETAGNWANYLVAKYGVVLQPTDGSSLCHTASDSMDLVQALKVFVCTTFLTTCRYLTKMARVARVSARVVFDVITETCMDEQTVDRWITSRIHDLRSGLYPAVVPKQHVIDFLGRRHLAFAGSFVVPMKPGKTECMVFVKAHS
jgi:hypothetical protein